MLVYLQFRRVYEDISKKHPKIRQDSTNFAMPHFISTKTICTTVEVWYDSGHYQWGNVRSMFGSISACI